MHNRRGTTTCLVLFLVVSSFAFRSAFVEQWGPIDEFIEAYVEHPNGIYIVIVTWFVLLYILIKMDIRVTPWYAAICFLIAIIVGYAFIYQNAEEEFAPPDETHIAIMAYIKESHPTTARLLENITWSGEDITPSGLVGKTIYQYLGGEWNITLGWAVIKDPTYEVKAEYSSSNGDLLVFWEGMVDQSGAVEEKIKGSYQSVESVRDSAIDYITVNLSEATVNISGQVWSLSPQEPKIGWVKYTYLSDGWNVTISHEVYFDVTYYVTVENLSENIRWSGIIYDGIVKESDTDNNQ